MPADRPVQGEVWRFLDPWANVSDTYRVESVTEDWIRLTPEDGAQRGFTISPYRLSEFMQGVESGKWNYVEYSKRICPRCEERPKVEGDYLCWECRYGE